MGPDAGSALLKVEAGDLPAALIGDSDRLRAGELVLAVGHPFGLIGAVVTGVVHAAPALGRHAGPRWVQADLRFAPGNSGGPMADAGGRVVGVNTMILGRFGPGRAEPGGRDLCDAVRPAVIAIAVLASTSTARARLEALVAARPGLRLADPPSPTADQAGDPVGAAASADVVLIDPGTRPVETYLRALSRTARLPPIMLLGGGVAPAAFARLLRAGVRAILPRDASAHEIAAGIEALAAGLVVLHPSASPASVDKPLHRNLPEGHSAPLTPRELEILGMMAEGMGNRAIGKSLGISTHTVKFHIAAILDKLSARSRTEAVAIGMRRGLLMV